MSYKAWYNEEADYNTNARSYMDYLARHNKFMKVLVEDYEVFKEILTEEFKQFQLDTGETIQSFHDRLDNIQQEMTDLFIVWLEDGTLETIINENIFNGKVDRVEMEALFTSLETQLDELTDTVDTLSTDVTNTFNRVDTDLHTLATETTELDSYLRGILIDVTRPPWNVPTDGSDASDAIQNVFDNLHIRRTAYFPNGTYTLNKPVTLSRELTILGGTAGELGGTIFDFNIPATTGEVIAFKLTVNAKNSNVTNLYLRNSSPVGTTLHGLGNTVDDEPITHLNVTDVWSVGFNTGFLFRRIFLSRFTRCYATHGHTGFKFTGHSTTLVFTGCYAQINQDNWYLENIDYSTLLSCASDNATRYGYHIVNSDGVSLVSCGAEWCDYTALHIETSRGIIVNGLFTHLCGTAEGPDYLASSINIDGESEGCVINGLVENRLTTTHNRTRSIIVGWSKDTVINGVSIELTLFVTPTTIVNGQRRSNVIPSNGTFQAGDIVYKNNFTGSGTYAWLCTESPGTFVALTQS